MENPYLCVVMSLFAVAFASFVTYDGSARRESRLALGIILLASLVLPLGNVIKGLSDIDFTYTHEGVSTPPVVEKRLEEAFCDGISLALTNEFSLSSEDVSVTAEGFDSEQMKAQTVFVTVYGRAALGDIRAMESFISGLGLGECVLEVDFG